MTVVQCAWQSQNVCIHSAGTVRHASLARNSQENSLFLTASGVGTQSPTWTIAVS